MALILYRSPFSVVYMVNTGGGSSPAPAS